ncbi:aminopeptidase [Skeletonema marinoi]|uniref:Aminopeptidase n=1 Tax=Skeletonema marinoi TaxID=267567 RepID=A0AAD8Y4Y1_9STRA|nr:aminopeptidase [Skeletonema marinoi]
MASSSSDKAAGRVLLPLNINPTRYDITLTPDLTAFTFAGITTIELTTAHDVSTSTIIMHAKELCFANASYTVKDEPVDVHEAERFLFFGLLAHSTQFTLILTIHYTGFLNNQMAGFYRSSYTDIHGTKKTMASTQFESLDARRCFPCWDEPARKAVFELDAFSNMPELSHKTLEGGIKKELTFLDTPIMSTYLLAFVIGTTSHGVLVRVYTPPGKSDTGVFALHCATKSLDAYDDFFGFHTPSKVGYGGYSGVCCRSDGELGSVTYREVDLLIDPTKASIGASVVWNLVTMTWWDDLWLNEGFASWAENWAADVLYPQWSMWDQFTTGHLSAALRLDALKSSHPIQVPIHHAEEVEEVFDAISYCKGGSVVKMIRAVLGMKAFQKGLGNYMKKHAYGNTETFDCGRLGRIAVDCLVVLVDGSPLSAEDVEKKWCIPILTCTEEERKRQRHCAFAKGGWVKLNAGQDVPMRVKVTSTMIDRLSLGIQSKTLPPADRAALLSDAYALVKAGKMQPEGLIKLLSSYKNEDSSLFGRLDAVMSDDPVMSKNFSALAKKIVLGLLGQVGWEAKSDDGHLDVLLRGMMIGLLSSFCYDDESVAAEALKRFHAFQADHSDMKSLPSDMRSSVFKIVLKNGGTKEFEDVKAYFDQASDNAERKHVLGSLGHTPVPKLKNATLEWAISGEIKLQDFFYPMGAVALSLGFMQKNFNAIKTMIGNANSSLMDAVIVSCAGGFCSNEKADEIEAFFKANPVLGLQEDSADT